MMVLIRRLSRIHQLEIVLLYLVLKFGVDTGVVPVGSTAHVRAGIGVVGGVGGEIGRAAEAVGASEGCVGEGLEFVGGRFGGCVGGSP